MSDFLRDIRRVAVAAFRLLRLVLVIFVALVALVVAVGAVLFEYQSEFLARYISTTVTRGLLVPGTSLEIGDIGGSPLNTIVLEDVLIRGAQNDTLLHAEELHFRYPPIRGIRRELSLGSLSISRAKVLLVEARDGGLVLPWRTRERRGPRPPTTHKIDELSLGEVEVSLVRARGDTLRLVNGFYVDGTLTAAPAGVELRVTGAAGVVPIVSLDVDWLTFTAALRDDRLFFGDIVADVGRSHVEGSGVLDTAGPTTFSFDVAEASIQTEDAWQAIDLSEVLGHGHVSGRMHVGSEPDGVTLSFDVEGVLNDDPIDRLVGRAKISETDVSIRDLVVESNGARIAGDLELELVGRKRYVAEVFAENTDLSDVPVHDELVPLHPHRLNGRFQITGEDHSLDFPRMEVVAELRPSRYLGVLVDTARVSVGLSPLDVERVETERPPGLVRIHSASARLGRGAIDASGEIVADTDAEVTFVARDLPIERFDPLHDVEGISGAATLTGQLRGPIEGLAFQGRGRVRALTAGAFAADSLDVIAMTGVLEPFTARAALVARGISTAGPSFDAASFSGTISDTIRFERLRAVRGDTLLVASGLLTSAPNGVLTGRLDAFRAEVPAGSFRLEGQSPIGRDAEGRLELGPAAISFGGGRLLLSVSTGPNGSAPRVVVDGNGVSVAAIAGDVGVPLGGGIAGGHVDWTMDPETPALSARISVEDLEIHPVRAERVAFEIEGGADSLRVRGLSVRVDGGRLEADAVLRGNGVPLLDLGAEDPLAALFRPGRHLTSDVRFDSLDVAIARRIKEIIAPATGDSAARSLQLSLYTRDREAVQDVWQSLEGHVTGDVRTDGPLSAPELRGRVRSTDLVVRGQRLDALTFVGVYRDSLLTVSRCDLLAGGHTAQVSGFVPCAVDLAVPSARLLERDMNLSIDLQKTPLTLLSVLLPEVIVLDGHFDGRGTITGTPSRPVQEGGFRLTGGEFRLAGRTEWLWDASARVSLASRAIVINDFVAREGSRGRVRASGNWSNTRDYRFQVELERFAFTEGGMVGVVDGTVNVSPDLVTAGRPLPRFDGVLRLGQAEIIEWPEEKPEQTAGEIEAIYDLTIDVNRINVSTVDVQATTNLVIGDGEMTLRNYPETLRLGGQLDVLEGGGTVYGNAFRMRRGTITFLEIDGVNPRLDLEAETRILSPYVRNRGVDVGNAKIVAYVTGFLKEPVIRFETEPENLGMSQTEVIRYLTFGRFASTNGQSAGGFEETAEVMLGVIAQDIARVLPYVDYVEITSGEDSPEVSLIKSLSDGWTIGYTRGFSSTPDQEISIEARLSRIFFIKGGVLREELGTSGEVGGRYNLDLRLNFEY